MKTAAGHRETDRSEVCSNDSSRDTEARQNKQSDREILDGRTIR